jgi:hypothetical protein
MKKIILFISLFLYSTLNQAGWISGLTKIIKVEKTAVAASKAATGAKGAATTAIAANEIDNAAIAARLNLTPPELPEYEIALIIKNNYTWASTKLATCINKSKITNQTNDALLIYCTSQYEKCLKEKQLEINSNNPDEICINQTNKDAKK